MPENDVFEDGKNKKNIVYLNIDHLKQGAYNLRITLHEKIIKSIFFDKK